MPGTGIVKDNRFMDHEMGPYHPESPKRLEAIYNMLNDAHIKERFTEITPREATQEELTMIHSSDYVSKIESTKGKPYTYLDPDTQTNDKSYDSAVLAAGGVCEAIRMVCSGELKNAFALIRPPGHHAEKDRAMGFCIFNNVAIGARYAQRSLGIDKVLIVDWDLHHGNGTQHVFEDDPTVLYFSTHQYPYYPGTGSFMEVGISEGIGFTVNLPLSPGYGDGEYVWFFENLLKPIILQFRPGLILISAGFDIYYQDPLGGMKVTPNGFAGMTSSIMESAKECADGKIVVCLEGGYHIEGLRDSVKAVLMELSGMNNTDVSEILKSANEHLVNEVSGPFKRAYGRYWNIS